jgi:hypothetical protein
MKKIIKLTERDLTRLVRQTIMELDRSTYERVADVADEKGYGNLSNKFREHGKSFGLNQENYDIKMVVYDEGEYKVLNLRIKNVEPLSNSIYILNTEDIDGVERSFDVTKDSKRRNYAISFLMDGEYLSSPQTKKDAQKVKSFFEERGTYNFLRDVDPRSISYEYTGL